MGDCLFCKIVADEIPADILYQDDDVLAFWDISPQAPKHFLVIPKKHISGPADVRVEDELLFGKIMRIGAELAGKNELESGFRMVLNNGAQAGQEVFHIHLHILGGRRMQWPPG